MAAHADGDKVKITRGQFAGQPGEVTGFRVRCPNGQIRSFEGASLEPWAEPPVSRRFGLTMRLWEVNDRAAIATLKPAAGCYGRYEIGLTDFAAFDHWWNIYASLGLTPLPLFGFDHVPTDAEIDACAAGLIARKDKCRLAEFGNELSYNYQPKWGSRTTSSYQSNARGYGRAARRLQDAVGPHGIQIEIIWDDGGQGGNEWFDNVVSGLGGAEALKRFVGTTHPYGPRGIDKIRRGIAQAKRFGFEAMPIDATEDGIACDNGRTLSDNYGWATNLTYAEAARAFRVHHDEILAVPQVRFILLYQTTDQSAPGVSSGREAYFGQTRFDGSAKGDLTAYAQSRLR